MVGNLDEWVADWVPRSTTCGAWHASVSPTPDYQCLAGALTSGEPGALIRGGYFDFSANAGPFTISGVDGPSRSGSDLGFRCAR
jgi:formylglycine-generating enzyme required for sulfatase activity